MEMAHLNLARKWRIRDFDSIAGQSVLVRMLKNSLYLQRYFPVYLFSGQRGCGKTSTARVFASALNCDNLLLFQKTPQDYSVPCLLCESCLKMLKGVHPDFFEMDAASHTGVDAIRQLIDSSQFLPLMGKKKIYLIDEAHMLSKAAFNALLKILEEPPSSVIFILATTDPQKIIETVRSRCFQLFFMPVAGRDLFSYLVTVCEKENIAYDENGLKVIINESQGSVRDALNMLDQVRFISSSVTKDAVFRVLGYFNDKHLLTLFSLLLTKGSFEVLHYMELHQLRLYSPEHILRRLIILVRSAIWLKHDVNPELSFGYETELKTLAKKCSFSVLNQCLKMLYDYELVFSRATTRYDILEMIILQFSLIMNPGDDSNSSPAQEIGNSSEYSINEESNEEDDSATEMHKNIDSVQTSHISDTRWSMFLSLLNKENDPLVMSVFRQGAFICYNECEYKVEVAFSKDCNFFKEWISDTESVWGPLLQKSFSCERVVLAPLFSLEVRKTEVEKEESVHKEHVTGFAESTTKKQRVHNGSIVKNVLPKKNELKIDVSDEKKWPKVNMILRFFPGKVTETQGATCE